MWCAAFTELLHINHGPVEEMSERKTVFILNEKQLNNVSNADQYHHQEEGEES